MTAATTRAHALLEQIRATPMRRGALSKRARRMRTAISKAIARRDVSDTLAQRVAFQLVVKVGLADLGDHDVWEAIAGILRHETVVLSERLGLAERQIVTVLPKLSAAQLEEFVDQLTRADRRIARTVLDAAIEAADPLTTGWRYLSEYRLVARQLHTVEPTLARTLANATFKAGMPLEKAMEHVERFLTLIADQKDNPDIARIIERSGFRAK